MSPRRSIHKSEFTITAKERYEGQGVGEADLREVQDRAASRRGARDLLESEA
jgi:hypothetical protein